MTLLAHCDTEKVTFSELARVPTPEPTETWRPVSHVDLVETTIGHVSRAMNMRFEGAEFALKPDGSRMFAVLRFDRSLGHEGEYLVGLRNSHDKSLSIAVVGGLRVFVCDNLVFAGDFQVLKRMHTSGLDLDELMPRAVAAIQESLGILPEQVRFLKERYMGNRVAKEMLADAFICRTVDWPKHLGEKVWSEWQEPSYDEFANGQQTWWRLHNAFTTAFKTLGPRRQAELTGELNPFFARYQPALPMPGKEN